MKTLKRTLARQPLASSEIIAIANNQASTNTEVGRTISLKLACKFMAFEQEPRRGAGSLVARHPDHWAGIAKQNRPIPPEEATRVMTAMETWATPMHYQFRSIPLRAASEFAVNLDIHVGRGQPPKKGAFAAGRHDA